jgi:hypothetical protein
MPLHGPESVRKFCVLVAFALTICALPCAAQAEDLSGLCNPGKSPDLGSARELATLDLALRTAEVSKVQAGLVSALKAFDDLVAQSAPARARVCRLEEEQESLEAEESALRNDGDRYNRSCSTRARDAECLSWYQSLVDRREALSRRKQAFDEAYAALQQSIAGWLSRFDGADTEIQGRTTLLCAMEVPELQARFRSLSERVQVDQQVVRNFGFDKTTEQIEQWGAIPAAQMEDAKKEFRQILLDASLASITKGVETVGSLTPQEVGLLNHLADAEGAPPLGIVAGARNVATALNFLDKSRGSVAAMDAARQEHVLDASVNLGGLLLKNPAYGLLLSADEWALYQVYQSSDAVLKVRRLTELNEGDLKLLRDRSDQLKKEVADLKAVRADLTATGRACDSTNLFQPQR